MAARDKAEFDVLAHDKASDKLDRISRAFRKLKNDSDNIDGDGLADLSKKLRKVADDFEKEGNRSGKGFGSGLKKWLTGAGANLGKEGGTVFGSGFLGALKTPVLGPALVAAIGGAVAVAAPAVGAIAGAGIVTGFGAGLAGLGLVFAAKSEAVQDKWAATMSQLGADMRLLSKPFEGTLIRIADTFEGTVDKFNPALAKAFAKTAEPIERFAADAGRALEGLIPAIGPITTAFNGVLAALGPALVDAVGDLSDGMIKLSNSVAANPQALADTVRVLGSFTEGALGLVTTLNDVNSSFSDLTGGLSLVEVALSSLTGPIILLNASFSGLNKSIGIVNALTHSADASGASMSAAANQTVKLAQGMQTAGGATKATSMSLQTVTDALSRQKTQFSAAITAMGQWNAAAIASSGSAIAYEAALDAATASIKENGRNTNISTEAGRANKTALLQVAEAANRQTAAMDAAGASNVSVARKAETSRTNFISLARQMGFSATEAKKMADKMIQIPNVSREAKLTANKKDLEKKVAAAKKELANKDLTRARTAALKADIRNAQRGIAAIDRMLGNLPSSKTTTITTRLVTERIARNVSGASGGRVPTETRAHGGPVKKGVPYLVGEQGPEPFIPDEDGVILPNSSLKGGGTALALAPAPQPLVVQLVLDGKVIQQSLLKLKRQNRGDLGLA